MDSRTHRRRPGPAPLPLPAAWATALREWEISLRAAGRSEQTIATRLDHARRLARAMGGSPWEVTARELEAWSGTRTWGRETRRSVHATVRGLYRWAVKAGYVDRSPAEELPTIRPAPPCPHPAPETAYQWALTHADLRQRCIVRLAGEAGLRRIEVARVHVDDLTRDLLGWSLLVHGKGGRDRLLPVSDSLAREMRLLLDQVGGAWLLPSPYGGHLTPAHVAVLANRVIPAPWTMHKLRHRFATRAWETSGGDLLAVQRLLGHASPATTQRYVQVDAAHLRRVMLAAA